MSGTVVTHRPSSSAAASRPCGVYQPVLAAPRVRRKGGGAFAPLLRGLILFDLALFAAILMGWL